MANYYELGYSNFLNLNTLSTDLSQGITNSNVDALITSGAIGFDQTTMGVLKTNEDMQSDNFVTGISGWRIQGNGTAEFQTVIAGEYIKSFAQDDIPISEHIGDLWYDTNDNNKPYRAASIGADQITAGEWEEYGNPTEWADVLDGATTKPNDNADVTLTEINGGLVLTGGGLTLSSGGALKGGQTDYDTGTGWFLGYSSAAYKFSIGDGTNKMLWDGTALTINGATVSAATLTGIQAGSEISIQGWTHDMVFSVTDADTVAWSSGTITLMDGTTYSIDAGNTGNMAAETYVYLDIGTSITVLQITTTKTNAVGSGKIMVAICENAVGEAEFIAFNAPEENIDGNKIRAASVSANEITANTITANELTTGEFVTATANIKNAIITNAKINDLAVDKLTAGTITSKAITLAVAAGTGDTKIQAGKSDFGDTTSGFILGIDDSDSDTPKFEIGDATYSMIWDGLTLSVNNSVLSFDDNFGDGSDGDVTTAGDVTLTADMYYNNLTVSVGDTLYTAGYRMFVKETTTVAGKIDRSGNNGANGPDGKNNAGAWPGAAAGGVALAAATLPGGIAGAAGGDGDGNYTNCTGITDGGSGSSQSTCLGSNGAAGGDGGEGGGLGDGGIGGTSTASVQGANILSFLQLGREFLASGVTLFTVSSGSGGGGGGCNHIFGATGHYGAGGGGAGGTGGYMLISSKNIVISATGEINCEGGNGGTGGDNLTTDGSGAGGGAGGNGGVLALIYNKLTNDGSISVTGGTGGLGGAAGASSGSAGSAGTVGNLGQLIQLQI